MAKSSARAPRKKDPVRGVARSSRSSGYHRRGLWAIKAKHGGSFPTHPKKEAAAPAEAKAPRFYPAEDVPKPLRNKRVIKKTKLRASITPGTVLILLAGHFKGKRVVFLKQLDSGLLLITGPFKVNGVPLRRVNQAYVIATSTKLDISSVDASKISDDFFKKEEKKKQKGENEFFEADAEEKQSLPAEKKEDQKAVDSKLLPVIESIPDMKAYLSARFSLKSGVKPHELIF